MPEEVPPVHPKEKPSIADLLPDGDESDDDDRERLVALLTKSPSQRGWVTRVVREGLALVNFTTALRRGSQTQIDELIASRDAVIKYRDNALQCLDEIASIVRTEYRDRYVERMDEISATAEDILLKLRREIQRFEEGNRPSVMAPQQQLQVANNQQAKSNEVLKPEILTREASPVELSNWIRRYNAYYAGSRMEKCTLPEQHFYFRSCIDAYLNERLDRNVTDGTPVLEERGAVTLISLLRDEFLIIHPLFSRRLELFRSKQRSGVKYSDYLHSLIRKFEEASMTHTSMEELLILLMLNGLTDSKLRDILLRETQLTREKIIQMTQQYEISRAYVKSINDTENGLNVSTRRARPKSRHRSESRTRNVKQRNSSRGRQKTRATSNSRDRRNSSNRPANQNRFCDYCKKNGHTAPHCFKRKNNSRGYSRAATPPPRHRKNFRGRNRSWSQSPNRANNRARWRSSNNAQVQQVERPPEEQTATTA